MVGNNLHIMLPNLRYMTETKKVRIEQKTLDIEMEKKLVKEIVEEEIVMADDKPMEVEENIQMVIPGCSIAIKETVYEFIPLPDGIIDKIPLVIPDKIP